MQQHIIETMAASDGSEQHTQSAWWEEQQSAQGSDESDQPYYPGEYNSWVCMGDNPCQQCLDNQDAGPIKAGDPFPSGDTAPPVHPHCQCTLVEAEEPKPIVPPGNDSDGGGGPGALQLPV